MKEGGLLPYRMGELGRGVHGLGDFLHGKVDKFSGCINAEHNL